MATTIEFSAQLGGKDASEVILPHFNALKVASRDLELEGFPFGTLAYILRGDGLVASYDLAGAGNLDLSRKKDYLSVDIGIRISDRNNIIATIEKALLDSIGLIEALSQRKSRLPWKMDPESLKSCLLQLIERYKVEIAKSLA